MAGAVEGDVFIGRKAQELRGLLKIKYPIEHGIVQDWDDMERIWQYIYSDELKTLSEEVKCSNSLDKQLFEGTGQLRERGDTWETIMDK